MTKVQLRNEMLRLRRESNIDSLKAQSQIIVKQIEKDENYKQANVVAIFYPMLMEVDLLPLTKDKKIFVLPRVEGNDLHFYTYNQDTELSISAFGVHEPIATEVMDDKIDYMLVPALSISKDNDRIGYGKGFYDAFLRKLRPKHVYGVIYDFMEVDSIETDTFDQKLDGYFKGSI